MTVQTPEVKGKGGLSVGIDVAEARKGLDLVALDHSRRVVASYSRLSVDDAAMLVVADLRPSVVCIDSPSQWSTSGNSREAERVLGMLGINAFRTPAEDRAGRFHEWMRHGFALYQALEPSYARYRGGEVLNTAAEYFPHASAVVLAGGISHPKDKMAFRRQVLEDNGVATTLLTTIDQLDAALGALTGRIALDGRPSWVGDPDEGALLIPAAVPFIRLPRLALAPPNDAASATVTTTGDQPSVEGPTFSHTCRCGCGAAVRREFLPGHDAKLRSRLLREVATGEAAAAEFRRRGWM